MKPLCVSLDDRTRKKKTRMETDLSSPCGNEKSIMRKVFQLCKGQQWSDLSVRFVI